MSAFANESERGFQYLAANHKSHRFTLLKHEMALDYILAKTGGLYMTLNITGDACVTIIPDNADNITSVITALEKIHNAVGPSESAGFSMNKWLTDQFCPWGTIIIHVLIPVMIVSGITFCVCTCALTCMRALLYRWIGGITGGGTTPVYAKIPL